MTNDNQIPAESGLLSGAGVQNVHQAARNIELIRDHVGNELFRVIQPVIIPSLRQTGDPDMALNNLERFLAELHASGSLASNSNALPVVLPQVIVLFGASRFLSAFCISHPDRSFNLLNSRDYLANSMDSQALAGRLNTLLGAGTREDEVLHAFRLFRKEEMLRIGLRDLLGKADLAETVGELSLLAEVCLQAAYERAEKALRNRYGMPLVVHEDGTPEPAGFAVIAMGKLGGGELNFSSDIDLMYVYSADGETQGIPSDDGALTNRISNHQYFVKLAEQISLYIGKNTDDGFVFRVDLRLRPEGQQGPLAQSLGGYEIYYESWGQTWERSALIKARPVAGDEAVGRSFLERITPFVYRKYLDFGAIVEIRDMKQKINREVQLKGKTHRDVKLGYGGIREIEFLIQALQLIYGGRDRTVRERGSLKALHILAQKGLLTYQEMGELSKAYVFLRTVEHRIQILNDQQTQTLPGAEEELRALARRTGYLDRGRETEVLLRDYAEHTNRVRMIYDRLLAQSAATPEEREQVDFAALIDADTPEQEAVALLERYGFRNSSRAYRNILLLREGQAFTHQTPRSRRVFGEMFPLLFREIAASTDPDMALNHLESYLAAQGSWDAFQSFVRQDPRVLSLMVSIFAASEHFSRMLIRTPSLLLDLLEPGSGGQALSAGAFRSGIAAAMDKTSTITDKLDALRRFKKREELRIGMADLAGSLSFSAVCRSLSRLAEVCLNAAFMLATAETVRRFNEESADVSEWGLAIIAAGKLGGREIIYGSDMDILFVYEENSSRLLPAGLSLFEFASKVAEKTIAYLTTMTREGAAYRVDARLRPTGSKGPLVSSRSAFSDYYAEKAEPWERQAMINARFVAGDVRLGQDVINDLHQTVYHADTPGELGPAVRSMRIRMETELGQEDEGKYNIKQGKGGLVDIEFLAQYLQLLHGIDHPRVRVPGTVNALRALMRDKLLAQDDGAELIKAYLFVRRIESRMRVVANLSACYLSRDPGKLELLARRTGYQGDDQPAGKALLDAYEKTSRTIRTLFERIVAR